MNMHVAAPDDSGDGKLRVVDSPIKQLGIEWKSANHAADNDKDESKEADIRHGRRIIRIENKILNTPLDTLDDIANAVDVAFMDGVPDWEDNRGFWGNKFSIELCTKIMLAAKKLDQRAKPPRRKPTPIPGRISNAELQREIDATADLVAKLSKKKKKRIGKR